MRIGDPVVGAPEHTSGEASSSHLNCCEFHFSEIPTDIMFGWDATPMLNWQNPAPHTLLIRPGAWDRRCCSCPPHLDAANLPYAHLPHSAPTFCSAPLFSGTVHPPCQKGRRGDSCLRRCGSRTSCFIPPRCFFSGWALCSCPVRCRRWGRRSWPAPPCSLCSSPM